MSVWLLGGRGRWCGCGWGKFLRGSASVFDVDLKLDVYC